MVSIWKQRYGDGDGNPSQCRASVIPKGESFGWLHQYQCTKKPKVFRCIDGVEYGFCGTHDPEAVNARHAARQTAWRAEYEAQKLKSEHDRKNAKAMELCREAMVKIAAGHNDPRSLAAEVLSMFPDKSTAAMPVEDAR